jgi:hypothetical protein
MLRRAAVLASAPVLAASAVLLPAAASTAAPTAAPHRACSVVPLTFGKSYTTGREHWQTKASLKVYDLCATGTFRGKVFIRGTGGTTEAALSPFKVSVHYKRQLDTAFSGSGVSLTKLSRQGDGWRPYDVTADDIIMEPSGGYFIEVRVRWTVRVGGRNTTKDVICDRIHDKGNNAYLCV